MTAPAEFNDAPASWVTARLGDYAEVVMGQAPPKADCNASGHGTPFVKVGEFGRETPLVREWTTNPLRTARVSDVLVCVVGATAGKVNRGIDCSIGRSVAAVRPSGGLSAPYLFHLLSFETPALRAGAQGSAQGVIKKRDLEQWLTPIPPLPEQHRIIEILEEQLSRLDAALESVRVVREKAAQFRRSLLHAAFTGALTGGATEPGHAPTGWVLERLDSVASVQLGRSRSPKNHSGPNMRPYLRAANVTWQGLDLTDVSEMNFSDNEMETYRLEPGDILVNEASGSASEVGKAAVFRGEISDCGFQNHLIRVRTNHLDNAYLHHFLMHNALSGVYVAESQGVGINHLGKGKLSAWPTPVPPLPEQQRIVEILEEQLSRLDASLAVADAIEKRSAALRRSLLHAAFTGRLTEQWREHAHV